LEEREEDGDWDERGRRICREAMGGEVMGIRGVVVWKLPVCPRMNVVQVEIHGYYCQFMWGFCSAARTAWLGAL
jgi:hypothetical protein